MKSLHEINEMLAVFEKRFDIPVRDHQQGSEIWFKLKLGVISASNASKAIAKRDSETRLTYLCDLVSQVATGIIEEINSKYVDWGKQHEEAARAHYEFATDSTIVQIPFVFKDDSFREGCSPDGIISDRTGLEIKCPYNPSHYVKFFCEDKIKPEYSIQAQFTMRVLGAESWQFVQYAPQMRSNPMKILTIDRDDKVQATLDDAVPQFIHDMDQMLEKIGVKFGDQWRVL